MHILLTTSLYHNYELCFNKALPSNSSHPSPRIGILSISKLLGRLMWWIQTQYIQIAIFVRRDIRNEYKVFPPKIRQNHQTSAMSFEEKILFSMLQKYIGFSWASKRIFKCDLDFTDLTPHILVSLKHFVSNQSISFIWPLKIREEAILKWITEVWNNTLESIKTEDNSGLMMRRRKKMMVVRAC